MRGGGGDGANRLLDCQVGPVPAREHDAEPGRTLGHRPRCGLTRDGTPVDGAGVQKHHREEHRPSASAQPARIDPAPSATRRSKVSARLSREALPRKELNGASSGAGTCSAQEQCQPGGRVANAQGAVVAGFE